MKKEWIVERNGRTFVLFAGLLSLAHELSEGRLHIATELIQIPNELNGMVAICRCEAKIADVNGAITRSCTGIADASPDNVGRMVANALIRMAEARSKSRALRDLVNASEAVDEAEEDPREPSGGEVDTTHGRRAEPTPRRTMADQELSRQPEARSAVQEPPRKPTPKEWFDGIAAIAAKNGVPVPGVPDAADREWFIAQGKRLQAETQAVVSGAGR